MNNKKNKTYLTVLLLLVFISIGYAALSTLTRINTHVELGKTAFTIHFDNIGETTHKATVNTAAAFTDNDTKKNIGFEVSLPKIGDFYSFTVDIINESTIPSKVSLIEVTGLTDSQKRILQYRAYYSDSKKEVTVGDYIEAESTKHITFEIKYKLSSDVEESDLPSSSTSLDGVFTINYENVDPDEYRSTSLSNRLITKTEFYPTSYIDFTKSSNNDDPQGVYKIESTNNDNYPIYFYRGGNNNIYNHVIFGGYCWRIIRTTDTGGAKMIYNGIPSDGKCLNTPSTNIGGKKYNNNNIRDFVNSDVQQMLNIWFYENLVDYRFYLEDTKFCNDNQYENGRISLECDSEHEVSVSNGKSLYPIGLITAEEANLCGVSTNRNTHSWLFNNGEYWTMTGTSDNENRVWLIGTQGDLFNEGGYSVTSSHDVRPVISLNRDVVISAGDGTKNTPYIVNTN